MIHIACHFIVPLLVAFIFYRNNWRFSTVLMIATMIVDLDHLLADPIYDPGRCSIGFHPMHSITAIGSYLILFVCSFVLNPSNDEFEPRSVLGVVNLIGLGLLIHMGLDWLDCII